MNFQGSRQTFDLRRSSLNLRLYLQVFRIWTPFLEAEEDLRLPDLRLIFMIPVRRMLDAGLKPLRFFVPNNIPAA